MWGMRPARRIVPDAPILYQAAQAISGASAASDASLACSKYPTANEGIF
jgi:hypothetical protein